MRALLTLWKFSRPHTVIGSAISIVTLYIILCANNRTEHVHLLVMALITGITSNIFIVGLNQIADVNIDKINKPWLPIPSGALNVTQAKIIVYTALGISLGLALYLTPYFFAVVGLSAAIGWAYSMPPFHLKRHHLPAALAISMVRGILVNAGGFVVFNHLVGHSSLMPENLKMLTLFITAFAMVIAWFKDLPDVEGDAKYNIKTFAILYSPKTAFISGNLLMGAAYLFTIFVKFPGINQISSWETNVLFYGHIVLLVLFILNSFSIELNSRLSVKRFYRRFWWFFFAEYALYLLACI